MLFTVLCFPAFAQETCPKVDPCVETGACYQLPATVTSLTFTYPADVLYEQRGKELFARSDNQWLPSAYIGELRCLWIRAGGGTPPYTFTATGLPDGLRLNEHTGQLTGRAKPLQGVYVITFTVGDAAGAIKTITRPMQVCGGKKSRCDGFTNGPPQ